MILNCTQFFCILYSQNFRPCFLEKIKLNKDTKFKINFLVLAKPWSGFRNTAFPQFDLLYSQCCGSGMFIPKNCFQAVGNVIRVVYPESGSRILDPDPDFYPSRIQGRTRHRIPDPAPQHCALYSTLPVVKLCREWPNATSVSPSLTRRPSPAAPLGTRQASPSTASSGPSISSTRSVFLTLFRNTPSQPIHCIVWAKHLFNQVSLLNPFQEHTQRAHTLHRLGQASLQPGQS